MKIVFFRNGLQFLLKKLLLQEWHLLVSYKTAELRHIFVSLTLAVPVGKIAPLLLKSRFFLLENGFSSPYSLLIYLFKRREWWQLHSGWYAQIHCSQQSYLMLSCKNDVSTDNETKKYFRIWIFYRCMVTVINWKHRSLMPMASKKCFSREIQHRFSKTRLEKEKRYIFASLKQNKENLKKIEFQQIPGYRNSLLIPTLFRNFLA